MIMVDIGLSSQLANTFCPPKTDKGDTSLPVDFDF